VTKWTNIWHSIFFKFSLAFLIVGMIPLLALSGLSLNQMTGQVERHTENNFSQMVFYLSKNVDDILLNYNEISKNMYYNVDSVPDLQKVTLQQEIDVLGQMNRITINDFLKSILFSDPHIQNALFVRTSDGVVFSQSRTNKVLDQNEPFPSVTWKYTLMASPKKLAVFPPHLETYFSSTRQVITFARNYTDTTGVLGPSAKVLGTLFFDVDLDIFNRLFRQVKLDRNDEMFVVDGNGYIIYSNQEDKLGKRFDELAIKSKGNMKIFSEPVPFIGGRVIGLISKTDLYASLEPVRSSVFIVATVCFLALIILGALFSRSFTRPILAIMRLMIRVESGHLDHGITVKRKDEFGRMAHGFNRMIDRLQSFINEAYVGEIKRKQTELNALKSQIRPHYLYNTLEVIRMSAVSQQAGDVADMIHSLSNQLQYVIDYGEEWVTVERELKHLRHYFHLIEVRYDRRIELRVNIRDENLMDATILKLSLQPIVENAVLHGFRSRKRKGTIIVSIEQPDDRSMSVTVHDDGVGMSADTVLGLNKTLEEAEGTSGKSIGITNVHARLRNACGEPYGIKIESELEKGTSVRILFPFHREGNKK